MRDARQAALVRGSPEIRAAAYYSLRTVEVAVTDPWQAQREALGAFIRTQRKMANLPLRQLAELTSLSNPYLSQVERGLHQPSVRVLKAISYALNLSGETLLAQAGLFDAAASGDTVEEGNGQGEVSQNVQTEDAIRADARLGDDQKAPLIGGVPQHARRVLR
jgi:transcriptional regulator with XRE-family HTH domain